MYVCAMREKRILSIGQFSGLASSTSRAINAQFIILLSSLLSDQSTENLRLCLHIIQVYVLLSPQDFFALRGPMVIETLNALLSDLRTEGRVLTLQLFETFLSASPQLGAELIKPTLLKIFE